MAVCLSAPQGYECLGSALSTTFSEKLQQSCMVHNGQHTLLQPQLSMSVENEGICAVKPVGAHTSLSCRPDLEFLQKNVDPQVLERLQHVATTSFKRISYTEAVELLTQAIREKKKKFDNPKVCCDKQPLPRFFQRHQADVDWCLIDFIEC